MVMLSRLRKDNEKMLAVVKKRWFLFSEHQRQTCWRRFFFFFLSNPMPHMSFTDFVVFPPGHGRSVTDF